MHIFVAVSSMIYLRLLIILFLAPTSLVWAQLSINEEVFFNRLKSASALPEKLLSTRSVVIYSPSLTSKELTEAQRSFQDTGIDAVAYFETDLLLASSDVSNALAFYFSQRDIINIVFLLKREGRYETFITGFNGKSTFIEQSQLAWQENDQRLSELLRKIYRTASSLNRANHLINEYPETELPVHVISGRRSEFFAIDLKVDQLAVPRTGNELVDKELEMLFSNYPFKYQITEPGLSERELRQKGFFYVLCFIHTRGSVAKHILGYDTSKPETAYVSVTYPDGQPQLKNIPSETPVYKFYFKHIDSGNVFLGTKWDADVTWQQALKNHLMAFKAELRIN